MNTSEPVILARSEGWQRSADQLARWAWLILLAAASVVLILKAARLLDE